MINFLFGLPLVLFVANPVVLRFLLGYRFFLLKVGVSPLVFGLVVDWFTLWYRLGI